jgi:hypothetical protein
MHFEILIEDQSGKKALDLLIPKILDDPLKDTFTVRSYKGIGQLPKNLHKSNDPSKRILLHQLPRLLQGYGKSYSNHKNFSATVIVICDLDDRNYELFISELEAVLNSCNPRPNTRFCLAIEEGEAWFLGDIEAIKAAYPKAKMNILKQYKPDSICGIWELLADAVSGGHRNLSKKGWRAVGAEKFRWAERISPKMIVDRNTSPSFCQFRDTLRVLKS